MGSVGRVRRLARFGWAVESGQGEVLAVKRDDGAVLPVAGRLMGTSEAARFIGVKPPNFVRDWASRDDFPAPLAALSSGRVWLAADVEGYVASRRPRKTGEERMSQVARRVVWWQSTQQTLERPLDFVARVMATGSLDEVRQVERFFGEPTLRKAVVQAPPGVFDRRAWNYWLLLLGLDRTTPLPTRQVP
jgi:prophage regulatory protein